MQDINFSNEKKIEILLKALDERYSVTKIIRERVQNICLWALGLFVTASGVIFQPSLQIDNAAKIQLSILIITSIIAVIFFYLKDLERGFNSQLRVQARIESILGLYKPDVYCGEPIYPTSWSHAGSSTGKGNFFLHNYFLLILSAAMFLLSVWIKE